MSELCIPQKSLRHQFPFDKIPTVKGSMYGNSITLYSPASYGAILDCVFEMADQIATSNGILPEGAIETVLRLEGWRILPSHKKLILERLIK